MPVAGRTRASDRADPDRRRLERLDAGPLAVRWRVRLQQPCLPTAVWTVTDLTEGSHIRESRSRGVMITAAHVV
jgi:hypothetical protein